jgi:uncharacterized protein (DUF305 family)
MYSLAVVKALIPRISVVLLGLAVGASCRTGGGDQAPQIIQPGAPGQASRVIQTEQATDLSKVQFTPADVKFMQGMIHHHAQAIDMTALLPSRTASEDMKKLALRISVSQEDEIDMMRKWLSARGQEVPGEHAHHMPGAPMMPGMLSPEEMARLGQANGTEFDRLFLEGMIKHHAGALTMVEELFSSAGAGQDSEIFAFASDVEADQRMEIDRMGAMLKELQK